MKGSHELLRIVSVHVVTSSPHVGFVVGGEFGYDLLQLYDPGRVWDLLDVDQVVVRHFPEHKKYDEL